MADVRVRLVLARARLAADDPRHFSSRMTSAGRNMPGLLARIAGLWGTSRTDLAVSILETASRLTGDDAARLTGAARFVAGDCEAAAAAFTTIRQPIWCDWNDLAAAQLCAASHGEEERLALALTAADQALALRPELAEARFNRAAIVAALGVPAVARADWRRALSADATSAWAAVASKELARKGPSERALWMAAAEKPAVTSAELTWLTTRYPEQARRFGEGFFLSAWAEAMRDGDGAKAWESLRRARVIAAELQRASGESLLSESIAAIDHASRSALDALVAGHLTYRKARLAYGNRRFTEAERDLRPARDAFAAGGTPMASAAAFFLACAAFDQDRPAQAAEELERLLLKERQSSSGHRALTAQIEYELALCEAVEGHWSASVQAAESSMALYKALREPANAAVAAATLAEDFDFLGRPDLAWRHGVAALRGASLAGDLPRVRADLMVLCRTEMRGRRWERAQAISTIEEELALSVRDLAMDADVYRRRAVIEWQLGKKPQAVAAIARARAAAGAVIDEGLRAKMIADVDGAAGSIAWRTSTGGAAIGLLTSAITFQMKASRPILLPELYLERGRAHLEQKNSTAAEKDFAAGITELERQRVRVEDPELRAGIFADAAELFDEAVALQLRLGKKPESVLAYVERGRARTVLEQIGGEPEQIRTETPTVAEIQQQLADRSILIEYVPLPRLLAIVTITAKCVSLRTVAVDRRSLAAAAERFTAAVAGRTNADSNFLYDSLIAPISGELQGVDSINIVGGHLLERVPFAALRHDGEYLVEQYAFATSPSAAVFLTARRRARRNASRAPQSALVVGNPTLRDGEFRALVNLESAEREAVTVAAYYAHRHLDLQDAATAEHFATAAPEFEVVHFAGHAIVRIGDPASSALLLASTNRRSGALTLRQIARMRFRSTRLVVLAACSTLRGRNAAMEGVSSLARGFLIAGVPAVVGTLWDINDHEAAPLMRRFHQEVAAGVAPADALRDAQLAAIRAGRAPGAWAAFALTGVSGDGIRSRSARASTTRGEPPASK